MTQETDLKYLQEQLFKSGRYDIEEGEIFEPTREQIAEFFGYDIENVHLVEKQTDEVPESTNIPEVDEVDEVIIEDETAEHYPADQASGSDNMPDLPELFKRFSEDEINQRAKEKEDKGKKPVEADNAEERRKAFREISKHWFKPVEAEIEPKFRPFIEIQRQLNRGKIISWAYLSDMKVFAVKRDVGGVEYFEKPSDLKTLPYPDMHQLARLALINSENVGMAFWVEKKIRNEFRSGWNENSILKPQLPKITPHPSKIHPLTGRPTKVVKFKAPRTMKKAPLRKMPQNFHDRFKWWYYDGLTHEAVIVLKKENDWELIRMLDPRWIRNCSAKDVETLHYHTIQRDDRDNEQALIYDRVASICYVMDMNA